MYEEKETKNDKNTTKTCQKQNDDITTFHFEDKRSEVIRQMKLKNLTNNYTSNIVSPSIQFQPKTGINRIKPSKKKLSKVGGQDLGSPDYSNYLKKIELEINSLNKGVDSLSTKNIESAIIEFSNYGSKHELNGNDTPIGNSRFFTLYDDLYRLKDIVLPKKVSSYQARIDFLEKEIKSSLKFSTSSEDLKLKMLIFEEKITQLKRRIEKRHLSINITVDNALRNLEEAKKSKEEFQPNLEISPEIDLVSLIRKIDQQTYFKN